MKLNDYQHEAMFFAMYKTPDYPFMALSEEAGEVNGKIAKAVRKSGQCAAAVLKSADKEMIDQLAKELGDVLWQVSACCYELGLSLEYVADQNLTKLEGRSVRNLIDGEGDDR